MKHEISAGVIVYTLDKDQPHINYLLLHYPAGHWDLPKGKIEGQETLRQAAVREVKEETGLNVEPIKDFEQSINYFFKDRSGQLVSKTVTFFIAQSDGADVHLSHEHINFKWLPLRDAAKQVTYANARQLLEMADHYIARHHSLPL